MAITLEAEAKQVVNDGVQSSTGIGRAINDDGSLAHVPLLVVVVKAHKSTPAIGQSKNGGELSVVEVAYIGDKSPDSVTVTVSAPGSGLKDAVADYPPGQPGKLLALLAKPFPPFPIPNFAYLSADGSVQNGEVKNGTPQVLITHKVDPVLADGTGIVNIQTVLSAAGKPGIFYVFDDSQQGVQNVPVGDYVHRAVGDAIVNTEFTHEGLPMFTSQVNYHS